jgi:hypothetical protein
MNSPMPRAWTRVTEQNAKPMRSRWLAWAAFVFEISSQFSVVTSQISACQHCHPERSEGSMRFACGEECTGPSLRSG